MSHAQQPFVPADFEVPRTLVADGFRLEPLGAEHNERDLAARTGSIAHIRATPGFVGRGRPPEAGMSAEANLADLVRHVLEFEERSAFAYSLLEGEEVIGCPYIHPSRQDARRVVVSHWVRADRAALDPRVHERITRRLREVWPFDAERIDHAPR
ncbi:N-acetyltransferase [Streptomyces sp. NPDC089795]|uniref:N-acetyltransferase n=1 Tax=Streptomyces sp. NPDC089795 TaxID=3155297 RepID=UPI003434E6D9